MLLNSFRRLFSKSQNRKARRAYPRPQLLQLENRIVPTNFQVTSLADTLTGGTLREAIDLANSTAGNDTITFASSLFSGGAGTITLLTEQLPQILSASDTVGAGTGTRGTLTITGPGASTLTISGNNGVSTRDFRIFDIAAGGNLSISGVTVSGANITSGFGGGGFFNAGTLTVTNSTISGNSASSGSGGGILNLNQGTVTVTNSTISGNSASNGSGGGIRNSGTLTVTNSTISGNSASTGGGIRNSGTLTTTVTNSTLSGNTATTNSGGGIYSQGTLTLTNSTLSGNTAGNFGGGLHIFSGTVSTVTNSTLSGNSANRNGGGGGGGGGINNLGTLNIANTIIANSTSGGDYVGNGTVNLISSGNGSDPTVPANNIVTQATSNATSAWATTKTSAEINLGTLANNGGPTQTLALLNGSAAISAGNATISNNPIYANGKDQRGINRTTSDIGAYSFGIQVTNTSDVNTVGSGSLRAAINLANTTPGNDQISFNLTGASPYTITLAGALPTIVSANTSVSGGTAGTVTITGLGATVLTISGDNNDNNRDFRIFNIASGGNLSISGVTVSGARITSGNGGGFNNSGTLTVSNSTISGNVVSGIGANNSGLGGGIFNNTNGTLTVNNSLISGNTATNGGGIYNRATLSLSNSTISGNHALASNSGSITSRYIYAGNGGGALHS